ncbi:MAG: type II 3-dehydroquinate dehydratase [Anaerolineales bacterium]
MIKIFVLHGPNLNLLGKREVTQYGESNLEELNQNLVHYGEEKGVRISTAQSNLEGELINHLQDAEGKFAGVVFNPGGYTHTSVAIRDAVKAIDIPVIEVHLTNILGREEFRHISVVAPVCTGTIAGFGVTSYLLGIDALLYILEQV